MNTDGLNVRTKDMEQTGTDVTSGATQFGGNLEDLKTEVAGFMQVWDREEDGQAETFAQSYEQRAELFEELRQLLADLGAAIGAGADTYSQSQQRIRGNIENMFDERNV